MRIFIASFFYCLYANSIELSILHTNDLHSFITGSGPSESFSTQVNDGDRVIGHYSRLSYLIKQKQKSISHPVLTVDAGDFYAGTLFHLISPDEKNQLTPELEFFQYNNYDFTTLGNHEFDAKDSGLLNMLSKIDNPSFKILASNAQFKAESMIKDHFYSNDLTKNSLITKFGIKTYQYQGETLKVAVLGALGPDGSMVS